MIYVGIDDTDVLDSRGTNQLAREIVRRAADRWTCRHIVRHQLLFDPRIPYTSHNGSASMVFEPKNGATVPELTDLCRDTMREWFIDGSDPGLCVTETVPTEVTQFGRYCQQDIATQEMARQLAAEHGVHLEGLGGTNGGVIGSLAAVGLAVTGDDGRIIQWQAWPDDLSGRQSIDALQARQIFVRELATGLELTAGLVDVGKHARPNLRNHHAIVFVERHPDDDAYVAIKLK